QGLIAEWHDQKILPGNVVTRAVDGHLLTAQMILLLISPDFVKSGFWTKERLQHLLERQSKGETRVIPILVRPVNWEGLPFADSQCLPRNGRHVALWPDQDEALATIVSELRSIICSDLSRNLPLPLPLAPQTRRQRLQVSWRKRGVFLLIISG